jgi:hypothetical protein
MSQYDLLDWAASRATDPQTSAIGANELKPKLTIRCNQFMVALEKLGTATANEVARQVAPDNMGLFGSIRRRASDLHAWGKIEIVDRRKCDVTGKMVSVYGIKK